MIRFWMTRTLDAAALDPLNDPKRADVGCYLDVLMVGCCGFG